MTAFKHPFSSMPSPCRTAWLATATALALWGSPADAAIAGYQGEFIPFPEASLYYHNKDTGTVPEHGSEGLVDFFYSAQYQQQWRLLMEAVVSGEEQDLERLVVGHVDQDGTQIWAGRYHAALGQWNHEFHHGSYLQPTIHRPGIIEWEDDGGVIPSHASGVSAGGQREINDHIVNYTLEFGLGPGLGNQGKLIAYDLLNPADGKHDLAITAKLNTHSNDNLFDDSGVFLGHITIPSEAALIRKVQQTVMGAYTNYAVNAVLWRGEFFYVANALDLSNGGNRSESFSYAYIEPEYTYNTIWTLYARWEKSFGAKGELYIEQIPSFVVERALIGARYQLSGSQALKVELANMEQYGQRFVSTEIQWSAALP